jgi:polyhydroxybutyrate depolymerase
MSRAAVILAVILVVLALGLAARSRERGASPDVVTRKLDVGGRERSYDLYVPPGERSGRRLGLVVALHGGASTPGQFERVTEFDKAAAGAGFAIAYPAGFRHTWNAGDCCGMPQRRAVDDVGFVRAVIDDVARTVDIDRGRVFASGWSNGGKMAYRLACELSDRIAAIGVVGTGLGISACHPAKPVSIEHFHGSADELHPFRGGHGKLGPDQQVSAPATIATWRRLDRCPETVRIAFQRKSATCQRWSPCAGGTVVELCTIEGMGHQWPGKTVRPRLLLGSGTDDIKATARIIAFFRAHGRRR